jgi:hypothetical protein
MQSKYLDGVMMMNQTLTIGYVLIHGVLHGENKDFSELHLDSAELIKQSMDVFQIFHHLKNSKKKFKRIKNSKNEEKV